MQHDELKLYLDSAVEQYQTPNFIDADPISLPHRFTRKEDIEIAGILTATISWGNRKAIVKKANELINLFGGAPYDFVTNASENDFKTLSKYVYRTFQNDDLPGFIRGLQTIYANGGLEQIFKLNGNETVKDAIIRFRSTMLPHLSQRTYKHIADVAKGAAGKRINMFLRWMVRPADKGVDFGIWHSLKPSQLLLPLDVHSANTSRTLGLLTRKQNDWKAAVEVTSVLKTFDCNDPIKYDFALFGLGINGVIRNL